MKDNLYVMLVDDHKLFREGLKLLLSSLPSVSYIKEACDGSSFLEMIESGERPDIIFMDISMPGINGIEATRKALKSAPELCIVALSMYSDENYYTQMIDAGVKGFILKNSDIHDVETAINHIVEGGNYFAQEIFNGLLKHINRKSHKSENRLLSEREEKVLFLVCKGLSNQEIADNLFISKRTVDKHRENLLHKTGMKNTAGLVVYAIKNRIVEI